MSYSRRKNRTDPDNLPTPAWTIRRFLEKFDISNFGDRWLEPSVGDGIIIETVREFRDELDWTAVEIRDTRPYLNELLLPPSQVFISDFFDLTFTRSFDVSIFNPPFSLAVEFIKKCREISDIVICFQTLNFLGSGKRHGWLSEDFPDVYVIPDRVSHKGMGRTDAVYSAWYVWGERKSTGKIVLLGQTSKEERSACYGRINRASDERCITLRAMTEEW